MTTSPSSPDTVTFTFTVAVQTDGSSATLDRCAAWAAEIADGMQQHHFPADDIAGCTPLAVETSGGEPAGRWTGRFEVNA